MFKDKLSLFIYILCICPLINSCREECYPNTEQYFETRFIKNGITIDPGYTYVYAPGGKGNIPLQETRYREYFYCLPIPLGKDEVTYYFENNNTKDSILIYYVRTDEYQSAKCGKTIRYSNPEVLVSSFPNVKVYINNAKIADDDTYEITINL